MTATAASGEFFFIQAFNASTGTSEPFMGLKIYWDAANGLAVGQYVSVTGQVAEVNGSTAVVDVREVQEQPGRTGIILEGISLTTAVIGSSCSIAAEQYEGMLVTLQNVTVWRDSDSAALLLDTSSSSLLSLTDGSGDSHLGNRLLNIHSYVLENFQTDFEQATLFIQELTGVVDYDGNRFNVHPRTSADLVGTEVGSFAPTLAPTAGEDDAAIVIFGISLFVWTFVVGLLVGACLTLTQRKYMDYKDGKKLNRVVNVNMVVNQRQDPGTPSRKRSCFDTPAGQADTMVAPAKKGADAGSDDVESLRPPELADPSIDEDLDSEQWGKRRADGMESPAEKHARRFIQTVSLGNMPQKTKGMKAIDKLRAKARLIIKLRQKQLREEKRLESRIQAERLEELRAVPVELVQGAMFNPDFVDELSKVKEIHEHKLDAIRMVFLTKRDMATEAAKEQLEDQRRANIMLGRPAPNVEEAKLARNKIINELVEEEMEALKAESKRQAAQEQLVKGDGAVLQSEAKSAAAQFAKDGVELVNDVSHFTRMRRNAVIRCFEEKKNQERGAMEAEDRSREEIGCKISNLNNQCQHYLHELDLWEANLKDGVSVREENRILVCGNGSDPDLEKTQPASTSAEDQDSDDEDGGERPSKQLLEQALQVPLESERMRRRARLKQKFAASRKILEKKLSEVDDDETTTKLRQVLDQIEAEEQAGLRNIDKAVDKERNFYESRLEANAVESSKRRKEYQQNVLALREDYADSRAKLCAKLSVQHDQRAKALLARLNARRERTVEHLTAEGASAEEIGAAIERLTKNDETEVHDLQQRMQDELFGKLAEHEAQCRNKVEELSAQEQAVERVSDHSVHLRHALIVEMQRRRELEEELDHHHKEKTVELRARVEKRRNERLAAVEDEVERQNIESDLALEEAHNLLQHEVHNITAEESIWLEASREKFDEVSREVQQVEHETQELKSKLGALRNSHQAASSALRDTMDELRSAKSELINRKFDEQRREVEGDPTLSEDEKNDRLRAIDSECHGELQQLETQVVREWEQLQEKQMAELRNAIQSVEKTRISAAAEAAVVAEQSHQDAESALVKMKETHQRDMKRLSEQMKSKKDQERSRLQERLAKKKAKRMQELARASEEEKRRGEEEQRAEAQKAQEELEAQLAEEEARLREVKEQELLTLQLATKRAAEEAEVRRQEAEQLRTSLESAREQSKQGMSRAELEQFMRKEQEEAARNRAERKKAMVEQRKKLMDRLAARKNRRQTRSRVQSPSNQRQKSEREVLVRKQTAELHDLEDELAKDGSIAEARQAGMQSRQLMEKQLEAVTQDRDDLHLKLTATVESLNKTEEHMMNVEDKVNELEATLASERADRRADLRRLEELEETNVTLEMQVASRSETHMDQDGLEDKVHELQEELDAQQEKLVETSQQLKKKSKKLKEQKEKTKGLEKELAALRLSSAAGADVAEAKNPGPQSGALAEAKMRRGSAAGAERNRAEEKLAAELLEKDRELAELRTQVASKDKIIAESKFAPNDAPAGGSGEAAAAAKELERLKALVEEKDKALAEKASELEDAQAYAQESRAAELASATESAAQHKQELLGQLAAAKEELAAEQAAHEEQLAARLQQQADDFESQLASAREEASGASEAAKSTETQLRQDVEALEQSVQQAIEAKEALSQEKGEVEDKLQAAEGEIRALQELTASLEDVRARAEEADRLEEEMKQATARNEKMWADLRKEQLARKKLHNIVEDMKGKIRVFARCRPMSSSETDRGCQECAVFDDPTTLTVSSSKTTKTFSFDSVFPPTSTQDEIFEDVEMLIDSVVDGYNVCVFAYGQTGSGKTFTMTGSDALPGLTPRSVTALYQRIADMAVTHDYTVSVYFLELYNDNLVDLLFKLAHPRAKTSPKLDVKIDANKQVFVKGAMVQPVGSAEEVLDVFTQANKMRKVGATAMNVESSRSHSVFSILVEGKNRTSKAVSFGKLSLIDLAGSERADKTGATKERLQEANSINKSLSALGDVISALSTGSSHVPYRNNKLTQLMQDSLGGNAKTLMFVNFSPADYNADETLGSLTYAARTKHIKNEATKHADSAEVARLKKIINDLESCGPEEPGRAGAAAEED